MTNSIPIVFFGSDAFSAVVLRALLDQYHIPLVITSGSDSEIARLASQYKIKIIAPDKLTGRDDLIDKIASTKAKLAVLASYGKIIPRQIINLFPLGIINVHPSLLPRWRGPSPIEAAILNGDSKTGITLIKLDEGVDTGPIYAQSELSLKGDEDQESLTAKLAQLGANLLITSLDRIITGKIKPHPQPVSGISYTRKLSRHDGYIKPSDETSAKIMRKYLAYKRWPKVYLKFKGKEIILRQIQPAKDALGIRPGEIIPNKTNDLIYIGCANNSAISASLLQPAGKRVITAREFINGYLK